MYDKSKTADGMRSAHYILVSTSVQTRRIQFMHSLNRFVSSLLLLTVMCTADYALCADIKAKNKTGKDVTAMKAKCIVADNNRLALSNVQVFDGDEFVNSITYQSDDIVKSIIFSDIKSISFQGDIDEKGYVQTKLHLNSNGLATKETVKIRVKQNHKKLQLQGFDNNFNRVSIDIHECKKIEFDNAIMRSDN